MLVISAAVKQEDEGYLDVSLCPKKHPPAQLSVTPEGLSAQQVSPHLWTLLQSKSVSLSVSLSVCVSLQVSLPVSVSLSLSLLQAVRRLVLASILQSESSYLDSLSRLVQV